LELSNQVIFALGLLFLVSIMASVASRRVGAPLLLIFLSIGMAVGWQELVPITLEHVQPAHFVGSLALAVILFDGGLRTRIQTFRVGLWPALSLATLGVVLTVGIVGSLIAWLFSLPLLVALLIGSIIGSTDAAAVFSLLRSQGLELKQRISATLEIESGSNDPMAIFLTIVLIEVILGQHERIGVGIAIEFVRQMGLGAALGLLGGLTLTWLINRVPLTAGLYPLLALAGALLLFGATSTLGGSGFLAIYLAGIVIGNRPHQNAQNILRFHDGMAWIAQIVMFLMLGLMVHPPDLLDIALEGLVVATLLVLVARPLAVTLCLLPFRFPWRDQVFISWVGLRGAVPILLGLFPLLAGVEQGELFFNIAFFVVLVSLLVQGWTIAPVARWLGLDVPPQTRVVHRLELDLPGQVAYELLAYRLEPDSPALLRRAMDLQLPKRAQVLSVIRKGTPLEQHLGAILRADDYVYVLATPDDIPEIDRLLVADHAAPRLEEHAFFGDFMLNGDSVLDDIANAYELDIPQRGAPGETLSEYLQRLFKKRAVVGDRIRIANLEFVVREFDGDHISRVGLKILPTQRPRA
jgi:potassium/hydrogen antiporter